MDPTAVALAVCGVYLLVTLVTGLVPGLKVSSSVTGFVAADRAMGTLVLYFVLGASIFSSFAFLGGPGWAYSRGMAALYILAYGALGMVPFYFFGPRARRLGERFGFATLAELLARKTGISPVRFALGLGANLPRPGEPLAAALAAAVRALEREFGPLAVAPLYRTVPLTRSGTLAADPHQPPYLNTAVAGTTARPPEALLAAAQRLERAAGRRRDPGAPPDAPRPLDVDVLVYGDRVSADPRLTLPHPRLRERRFVLAPLADVAPDLPIPPDGATAADLLAEVGQEDLVERVGPLGEQ
jgi:2-amino-4-hydroxy-6-hydroxymethyldihydropteridine diphosphokinase